MHHVYRAAFTVSTITELLASLEKLIASTAAPIKTSPASVAFIFTGQGSHYLKMGKELFDNCFTFRRDILEYDNICQRQDLPSFKALIDGSVESLEVLSPIQVELALISIELALANLCLALGFKPTVVVGHSHGEYAALCVAGVLSVNDAIYLVGKRASLLATMCNRGSHAMLAVMLDAVTIKKDLVETGSPCEIACFNSPQSTVISGCAPDITSLVTYYKSKEVKTVQLQIPFAFHSSQLEAIMKDFRIVTEGVSFGKPIIPVGSTLLGRVVKQEGIFTAEHLCRHARESVKFLGTIEECKATGIIDDRTIWIEIGPSPVCLSMVKSILKVPPSLAVHTLKKGESSLAAIANCISKVYAAGVDVNWMAYHREYESAHRLLPLPTYAFDLKNYWIQYEGDWCLRKNVASSPELVQALVPTFFGTTTLQRIERENFDSSGANVLFASDFTEPKLRDMVLQHRVNGIGLCPCSVFADMAFTAAKYIQKRCDQSTPTPPMDVMHMEALETFTEKDCIDRPLIYISANRKTGSNTVELAFMSEEVSHL
jgi:iron transport multicopper oxidase